ncbi:MAG: IgGFc-binding protein [Labilithrix sp.]|nr:IgGFc-binding protein [Labilithrix sp.]
MSDIPVLVLDGGTRNDHHLALGNAPSGYFAYPVHLWQSTTLETGLFKPGRPDKLDNPSYIRPDGEPFWYTLTPGRTIIAASEDDTHVTFPELEGGTGTVTLDRGQVFSRVTKDAFVGHAVTADKPIGVVSITQPNIIPWDYPFGHELDGGGGQQASMPETVWGSEYVAVRHADRWQGLVESPPWRILGGADGTRLSYEPARPEGAPEMIGRGELAIFESGSPFVVRSQDDAHRFYLSAHMTGGHYMLQRNGRKFTDESRGGSVSIGVLTTSRWAKRYPFLVVTEGLWPEHHLVVVRRRGASDVTLDCAGTLTGWQTVDEQFEYVRVPLRDHDGRPTPHGERACTAGPHWIESHDPFHATLWGTNTTMRPAFDEMRGSSAYGVTLFGADLPPSDPAR